MEHTPHGPSRLVRRTVGVALVAAALTTTVWAIVRDDGVRRSVARLFGAPPRVAAVEAYPARHWGPPFDHSRLDGVLSRHVDEHGWVDYESLALDERELDHYLEELAAAPFEALGRDQKLALLINAYNAFTLRLILDHAPVASIQDIPSAERWDAVRWQVGSHTWSLNQIEHEEIRPKFREARIHFALVCAAIGCPPLRHEAYVAGRLEEQLAQQTIYVHARPRWLQVDETRGTVRLTKLYDWYADDFVGDAESVVAYAARFSPPLRNLMGAGRPPRIQWLPYDWRLNSRRNRESVTQD